MITLKEIKAAIVSDTIEWIDKNAEMINYGTDGDVRYQQEAKLNGERVMIKWDTTPEYDEFNENYNRFLYLKSENQRTEEEDEEYEELEKLELEDNGFYLNDESNNCDWNDPSDFEILD